MSAGLVVKVLLYLHTLVTIAGGHGSDTCGMANQHNIL